jgi:ATP-dependent DNA helicase RecQ
MKVQMTDNITKAREILHKVFGYDNFRDGQERIVSNILAGRDGVYVLPTGAGKSICFQIPALVFDGTTIVISPLISLMKDQIMALREYGLSVAYINSELSQAEYYSTMENARNGKYKLIYVAPERLSNDSFADFICDENIKIDIIAVDEAHCVSQ